MNEFDEKVFRGNIQYFLDRYSRLSVYRIKNSYFGLSGGKEHYWHCKFSKDCTLYIDYRDSFLLRRITLKLTKALTRNALPSFSNIYYRFLNFQRLTNSRFRQSYFDSLMKK